MGPVEYVAHSSSYSCGKSADALVLVRRGVMARPAGGGKISVSVVGGESQESLLGEGWELAGTGGITACLAAGPQAYPPVTAPRF